MVQKDTHSQTSIKEGCSEADQHERRMLAARPLENPDTHNETNIKEGYSQADRHKTRILTAIPT